MQRSEVTNRIGLFQEMLSCCHKLLLCSYDTTFYRIGAESEDEKIADDLFSLSREGIDLASNVYEETTPLLFSSQVGMHWLCNSEDEFTDGRCIYVLGPFFMDDYSEKTINSFLSKVQVSDTMREGAWKLISTLPVLSWGHVQEYALMLHFLITGQKIHQSDLRFLSTEKNTSGNTKDAHAADRHGTYQAEQEMLRMVREGNLELVKHIDRIAVTGTIGQLASPNDSLRQMKNAVQVSITLFSRASIEGGLSPETAYTLCDRYFQNVEKAKSLSELKTISYTLQRDFVERVHAVRTHALSKEIESACGYIERHLEDDLTLERLANHAGYADYYFSKKFKHEMGISLVEYIRTKRLDKAAMLLLSTNVSVQEIAMSLQFCSQSYFTDSFRKQYGISPSKFRKTGGKIRL